MATMALHSHLAYDRLIHVLLHSVENFLASALPMHCRPRSVGNFSSQPTEMRVDHPEEPSFAPSLALSLTIILRSREE